MQYFTYQKYFKFAYLIALQLYQVFSYYLYDSNLKTKPSSRQKLSPLL